MWNLMLFGNRLLQRALFISRLMKQHFPLVQEIPVSLPDLTCADLLCRVDKRQCIVQHPAAEPICMTSPDLSTQAVVFVAGLLLASIFLSNTFVKVCLVQGLGYLGECKYFTQRDGSPPVRWPLRLPPKQAVLPTCDEHDDRSIQPGVFIGLATAALA